MALYYLVFCYYEADTKVILAYPSPLFAYLAVGLEDTFVVDTVYVEVAVEVGQL